MRQNYSGAAAYFKRAADKGDRDGLTNLAVSYDNGWVEGHPPDKVWTIRKYLIGFQNSSCIMFWLIFGMSGALSNRQKIPAQKFRNFLGKSPETPKIVEFPKCKPWHGNSGKKGRWNGSCALFRKFRKMLFHSILEISENSNRNFCLIGKPH